jgi:lactate dehydrogenase-like 2-hydroxyacid dehydrogenase
MKPKLLIVSTSSMTDEFLAEIKDLYDARFAQAPEEQQKIVGDTWLHDCTALFCTGSIGVEQELIEGMPKLSLICCKGTGYDALDVSDLKKRGISITHGAGANATSVADQAFALILATVRHLPQLHAAVQEGLWATSRNLQPIVACKRLGILGYGQIGAEVAKRAGGFDMPVAYHNRRKRNDIPHAYHASPTELAKWCDILIVSTVGGAGTRHLVDREVLSALGPNGYLVNVARGSVVDTAALIDALNNRSIAGAGLDVVDGEPSVPEGLLNQPNLVMTPHIGGRSPDAAVITLELVINNLKAHYAGRPLVTPIPENDLVPPQAAG